MDADLPMNASTSCNPGVLAPLRCCGRLGGMQQLVVVTGASSGIGEATARRLAADGARVVVMARRAERLNLLAEEIGGVACPVDLSDAEATAAACRRILDEEGVPDVIVNNAGAGRFLSIEETSSEEMQQMMALPFMAAFNVTRGFIEPMIARGSGTIFQINTPVAIVPWPGAVGYASARYALLGFTESLRQDLWETGIKVGQLMPPRVDSGYFAANPGARERIPAVGRLAGSMTSEQVADAVAHCLEKAPGKNSYRPWQWRLTAPLGRHAPKVLAWLYRISGHRRAR